MKLDLQEIPGLSQNDQTHWQVRVLVIETEGQRKSPALDALDEWKTNQRGDYNKIFKVMKRVAQTTRVRDPNHVKRSGNPDHGEVYEMRAHRGHARLMFFYARHEKTAVVVCTNAHWKNKGSQDQAFGLCDQLKKLYDKQFPETKHEPTKRKKPKRR